MILKTVDTSKEFSSRIVFFIPGKEFHSLKKIKNNQPQRLKTNIYLITIIFQIFKLDSNLFK